MFELYGNVSISDGHVMVWWSYNRDEEERLIAKEVAEMEKTNPEMREKDRYAYQSGWFKSCFTAAAGKVEELKKAVLIMAEEIESLRRNGGMTDEEVEEMFVKQGGE